MGKAKIIVAGIGPGSEQDITPAVINAVKQADVIVGYKYYFQFISRYVSPDAVCVDTGMKREKARAEEAFNYAQEGKTVCVISSGDAGPPFPRTGTSMVWCWTSPLLKTSSSKTSGRSPTPARAC